MKTGIIDISKHPILKKCYQVCVDIEKAGSGVNLTKAQNSASELLKELDFYIDIVNQKNEEFEYTIFKEGDMWCAIDSNFINIQENKAGFGITPELALKDLLS
jgi:hypothetical protein